MTLPLVCLLGAASVQPSLSTGKERDAESGNDYFGARYYTSSMGRFMSPDPSALYYADPTDPQSLNLYAYVGNSPLNFTDPDGLMPCSQQQDLQNNGVATQSTWCSIVNFFKKLFSGSGDGGSGDPSDPGGGGGGGGGMPSQRPLSPQELGQRIDYARDNFSKPCDAAYKGVGNALGIPYSKGAFANNLANMPKNQQPNATDPNDPDAEATTSVDRRGRPSKRSTITMYHDFYADDTFVGQAWAMWHEGTHGYFGIGDTPNNAPSPGMDFVDQFKPFGYTYKYITGGGTSQFTTWISKGCQ